MINIKILEKKGAFFSKMLKKRKFNINLDFLIKKIKLKNKLKSNLDKLKNKINNISKFVKNKINKNVLLNIKNNVKNIKVQINNISKKFKLLDYEINNYCLNIPNIPDESIFEELNSKNLGINYWGNKKIYNFNIKDYISIGNNINCLDTKISSRISGSKFIIMKNKIALIHRALIQFMLDLHINKHKYQEIYLPLIVNNKTLYNTGQLPKFNKNIFFIENYKNKKMCLIPTSEVPLVNMFENQILNKNNIPIKYVSYTSCFRNEDNTYGKNSGGLIRLNQFDKVELIQIVYPKLSFIALEEITSHAENVLKLLNLHYRKRLLFPNEMSFSSCKTYDLEVWFPYKKEYIEVSSCSNTSDFQSRKMLIRFKNKLNNKYELLHILNGSGLAVNRTLAAIIENYQNKNMDFEIPKILIPYIKSYL